MKNKYLNIFLVLLVFCFIFFVFYLNNKNNKIYQNIVIIEKKEKIIKNSTNPKNILQKEENTKKIVSNWFFISKNKIITSAHSVWNKDDFYEITTYFWEKIKAKLIKKDSKKDLAFLETIKDFKNFKKVKFGKKIKKKDKIFFYFFNPKTKKVEKYFSTILDIKNGDIISKLQLKKWSSGSALFNKNFEIIWINKEFDIEKKLWISSIIPEIF